MRVNNFKKLMEEDEEAHYPNLSSQVQNNVENTLGIFRFFGQIVEVFLPKVVDTFIAMSSSDAPNRDEESRDRRTPSVPPKGKGPSQPPITGR